MSEFTKGLQELMSRSERSVANIWAATGEEADWLGNMGIRFCSSFESKESGQCSAEAVARDIELARRKNAGTGQVRSMRWIFELHTDKLRTTSYLVSWILFQRWTDMPFHDFVVFRQYLPI